jgi:adenine-specific DNA-methyltransferase
MAKKDYTNLTKDQLLEVIEKLEGKKKYGLVWDEERVPEKVVTDCQDKLPVLTEVKGKEITTDENEPTHILIEGDNYHALSVLNYTHKGKIDLIYIDPPYNTGKDDEWKYNDKFVDNLDTYRHSKWLTFMTKRLELARNLMKDEGLIFISIDDNEIAQARLICDKIFGEDNFVNIICQKSRHSISNDLIISENHNFLLFYAKKKPILFKNRYKFRLKKEDFKGYANPNNDPEGPWKLVPVDGPGGETKGNPHYEFEGVTGYWRYSKEDMQKYFDKGLIVVRGKSLSRKAYLKDDKGVIAVTTWWDDAGVTTDGTNELIRVLGSKAFNNPKPVSLIKRITELSLEKDGIILDFFAGSGTTGQAIIEMNAKDGGKRQVILCTNNENKICEEVTYPRVRNIIKGFDFEGNQVDNLFEEKLTATRIKKGKELFEEIEKVKSKELNNFDKFEIKVEKNNIVLKGLKIKRGSQAGLGNNLKYFKTSFVANNRNKDQLKIDITKRCTEMLCLKEGIYDLKTETTDYKIFKSGNRFLAVYYDFANASLDTLKDEMNALKGEKILYCFTVDAQGLDKANFRGWKNIRLEPIPQKILDVYKRIFKN